MKIVILGAAGGVGQALALLLKNKLPSKYKLILYDINPIILGIAKDLSHIPTDIEVIGFSGNNLTHVLDNANIVFITAGITRKPDMKRSELFNINSNIIYNLINNIKIICPQTLIGIITNPINSLVPIAAEIFKQEGINNKKRLFGITTLDVIRSNTFVAEFKNKKPQDIEVKVIGGHSGTTILPLLSQISDIHFTEQESEKITKRIQNAGMEIINAKNGNGSATLAMGQAAARFCLSLINALNGHNNIIECAYIESNTYTRFFSHEIHLGKDGIQKILPINMNSFEKIKLENIIKILKIDIKIGENFIKNKLYL